MKTPNGARRAWLAILAVLGMAVTGLVTAAPASAAEICEKYGTVTAGNYIIQNNKWGTSATQCINTTSNGFQITQQDGIGNTSGAPVSYPSIYFGCHYSNCSPGSTLPKQLSSISSAPASVSYTYQPGNTYNASFDIWLNPTSDVSGVQASEIMIWFDRQGNINPIGSYTGSVSMNGRVWEVWTGNNGGNNVVSFVAPSAIGSLNFDVMDFVDASFAVAGSQFGNQSWYLTSVQAGFEPWIGGVGLAVNSFSASVQDGSWNPPDDDEPTTPPPGGSGDCSASLDVVNSWNSGFQAEVTVTANGSINGWSTGLSLAGATVNQVWNGALSGSGSSVTVSDLGWNGSLGAGQSTTYGFTADGAAPTSASLTCTAG